MKTAARVIFWNVEVSRVSLWLREDYADQFGIEVPVFGNGLGLPLLMEVVESSGTKHDAVSG